MNHIQSNNALTTGEEKMKKLTKKDFKKMIIEAMNTGLNSFEAMSSVMNEYEMYALKIIDAHTEILLGR